MRWRMCRWLGYFGSPIRLEELVFNPDHSLVEQSRSGVALAARILYTPTFVVAENGREVGRIEGYPGEDFFWGRLDSLMRKLPAGP